MKYQRKGDDIVFHVLTDNEVNLADLTEAAKREFPGVPFDQLLINTSFTGEFVALTPRMKHPASSQR